MIVLSAIFFTPIAGSRSIYTYLFRYSDTGNIILTVNGENVALDNTKATYSPDWNDDGERTSKISDNKYKFRPGDYGRRTIYFTIPADAYGGDTDIICQIKYFANSGNVNCLDINIQIATTDDGSVYVNGSIQAQADPLNFNTVSKEISEKDNLIIFDAPGP